jgi:putative MATE family efflux protein
LVWALVWPIILTNLLNVTVGMIDFKMVGVLGVAPIAAVGMARQVMMFLMVVMIAISGGSSVLIAHAHGAEDRHRVGDTAAKAMGLMILAAVVLVTPLGLVLSRPILVLLGASDTVVELGMQYLSILFIGAIFTMFNIGVSGILLGVGRTKVSLCLLVGVNLLNIGFNYVLIYGAGPVPAMGVAGAALGTVLARGLGSGVGLWILMTPRLPVQMRPAAAFRLDMPLIRKILYLGGPRSLQGVVRNFSRLMTICVINLLPDATRAVATYTVAMQTRMISSFVGLAFMGAAMSRVGQNLGKGEPQAAEHSGWISASIAAAMMTVVALFFLLFPESIMGFFTDDGEVVRLGRVFFMIVAVTEPVMAFAFALGGALRGGGDSLSPFIYASVSDLVVVVLAGYILAVPCHMGFTGIALAIAISSLARAIPTTWKFRQGAWKNKLL